MTNNINKAVLLSNAERFFIRSSALRMARFIDGTVVYESLGLFGCYWVADTGSARQLVDKLGFSLVEINKQATSR